MKKHLCFETEQSWGKVNGDIDRPPHYFSFRVLDSPDGKGMNYTGEYMHTADDGKTMDARFGWGIKFSYCPICGEKL